MKESFAEKHMYNTATVKGGKLRPVLLCGNIPAECESSLGSLGIHVLRLPPFVQIAPQVADHPDMLLFAKGEKELLTYGEYRASHSDFFARLEARGLKISSSAHRAMPDYPHDVGLNALVLGGVLFAKLDSVCGEILSLYHERVNVKQGYTRCSVCVLSEKAVITADKGLAGALENFCDILLIQPGGIRLDGYGYGFIGGASATLPGGTVGFFGNILSHPDGKSIVHFAELAGVEPVSLSNSELSDFGGGILIDSGAGSRLTDD